MKLLQRFASASLFVACIAMVPASFSAEAFAQETSPAPQQQASPAQSGNNSVDQPYKGQDHDNIQTKTSQGKEPTKTQFTEKELLTATVHQAWLLSGKDEANFLEIVEQLADISSHNRGVKLPDSAAAGRRMGEDIKRMAAKDTDQLLYAVVDKAVLNATTDKAQHAGTATHPSTEATSAH